jgi:hypothetical protein
MICDRMADYRDSAFLDLESKRLVPQLEKVKEEPVTQAIEQDLSLEQYNIFLSKTKEESSIALLYGTTEERFNNAVALKEYLKKKIKK